MRWFILRTLLHKELLRHAANKGSLALVLLLVVASMLLSFFGASRPGQAGLVPGVQHVFIDYTERTPLVQHLRSNLPEDLGRFVTFRWLGEVPKDEAGQLLYSHNCGAIQLRQPPSPGMAPVVWFWHPGDDGSVMAPFEVWFWRECLRHEQQRGASTAFEVQRTALRGGLDPRSGIATALVVFGIFFVCVYLLPSLTCEERERGVLLAQALSPASTTELLASRFLFYPVLGLALAAILAGTYSPGVLLRPFFWLGMLVCVTGSMGTGLTIASLARTQRAASMGAMCYLMGVSLLLLICQQNSIPGLPWLAMEYHVPRILHAALTDSVRWYHWGSLAGATALSIGWCIAAAILFRRFGWQ